MAGGVLLAAVVFWAAAHGRAMRLPYGLAMESAVAMAIIGGVALWRGQPPGFLLSSLMQLLQIVQSFGQHFTFALLLGPSLGLVLPGSVTSMSMHLEFGGRLVASVGTDNPAARQGLIINVIALVTLLTLLRFKRRSGQPWLTPRASREPWNAARIIGAYQVAAGAFGIAHAANATESDQGIRMATVAFSIIVIGSGLALVYRARWSAWVGVAVNGLQVPVILTASWALILHSGFSFDVLATSDDLLVTIDIGGMVNQLAVTNADGFAVDNFIGINFAGLALAIVLVVHQMKSQAASPKAALGPDAKAAA